MMFKPFLDFHNRSCLLMVRSMPTINLFVHDDRWPVWMAEYELA